MTLVKI